MSTRGKKLILAAFIVTLSLGGLFYAISDRKEVSPWPVAHPLGATWWDDFATDYRIGEVEGVFREESGVRLSRIRDLGSPVAGASGLGNFALAPDGRLFGAAHVRDHTLHLFVYDPDKAEMSDLGAVAQRVDIYGPLAIGAARQEIYAGLHCWDDACDGYLLVYHLSSRQARHVYLDFADEHTIVYSLVVASDGIVYGTADSHLFSYDPETDRISDLGAPADEWDDIRKIEVGADGNLYGFTNYAGWFKYETANARTTWILKWTTHHHCQLVKGDNGKLYLWDLDEELVYAYDPLSGSITDANLHLMRRTDYLSLGDVNNAYLCTWEGLLLRHNLVLDTKSVLDGGEEYVCYRGVVDATGRVYMGRSGYFTYHQRVESPLYKIYDAPRALILRWLPPWATRWLPPPRPAGGQWREYHSAQLVVYQPDTFASQGVLTSRPIRPHTLMVTSTQVSDANLITALAWGNDGRLYGVTGGAWNMGWQPGIVRYDPVRLAHMTVITVPLSRGWRRCDSTAIVADPAGRLVAGIDEAGGTELGTRLVTYDPIAGTIVTAAVPISNAYTISALATAPDGSIYGSTAGHLFVYSPAEGTVVDLGSPFATSWTIMALAVAPDGRVYGGGGPADVVDSYFTAARSSGSRLFVYDPNAGTFDYPSPNEVSSSRIRALLAALDGKIYAGKELGSDGGFVVYDPATGEWREWETPGGGDVTALAIGSDGLIYGGSGALYSHGSSGYLFVYDPDHPDWPPRPIGTLHGEVLIALLSGANGMMYGATGSFHSFSYGVKNLVAFRTDCASGRVGAWERVIWDADTPRGTDIRLDVLDENGSILLYDVRNGSSLWAINPISHTAISLQATLSTHDERVTPVLKSWQVDYTFECTP